MGHSDSFFSVVHGTLINVGNPDLQKGEPEAQTARPGVE